MTAGAHEATDPGAFHVLAARVAGETVATGLAFDHGGDCSIFNLSTLAPARGRGLGTALAMRLLRDPGPATSAGSSSTGPPARS
jgi:ribosomal protein S18 acetylase RimI-like enzyme